CLLTSTLSASALVLFQSSGDPRALHSFPTRRSSDLDPGSVRAAERAFRGPTVPDGHPAQRASGRGTQLRVAGAGLRQAVPGCRGDRKSTRLNSSHVKISYAVFCLKKKRNTTRSDTPA